MKSVSQELDEQARQILYFEASAPIDMAHEALMHRLWAIYEAGFNAGKKEKTNA